MTQELMQRLGRVEASDGIRNLKIQYAHLCDTGYDPDALGALFTKDAIWDGGSTFGRYEGVEEIRGFFGGLRSEIVWALHYMIGPYITALDAEAGTGEAIWYLWMPYLAVENGSAEPMLFAAKQFDRYRREDGTWKFSEIRVQTESAGPFLPGWAQAGETKVG